MNPEDLMRRELMAHILSGGAPGAAGFMRSGDTGPADPGFTVQPPPGAVPYADPGFMVGGAAPGMGQGVYNSMADPRFSGSSAGGGLPMPTPAQPQPGMLDGFADEYARRMAQPHYNGMRPNGYGR